MNEKILELKEEYERFLDTLPTLKDGENKDPITDWWIGKVTQAIAEERERVRGEIKAGVEKYKLSKQVGNMAGDYIFTYDLETFVLSSLQDNK